MINIQFYQNDKLILNHFSEIEINLTNIKKTTDIKKLKYKEEKKDADTIVRIELDDELTVDEIVQLIEDNTVRLIPDIDPEIEQQNYFDNQVKESLLRLGFKLPKE